MLARARSLTRDPNVTFRIADIERLDLPPASVDLVYSSLVLHYIEDFAPVAAALRAVLADGGYLVASVEHPSSRRRAIRIGRRAATGRTYGR